MSNRKTHSSIMAASVVGLMLLNAAAAAAVTTFDATVTPTKSNGKFIAGTGIPADHFAIDTAATGESVALKGRLRDTGQALSLVDNRYTVSNGFSTGTPSDPSWVFDWQFSPGDNGTDTTGYLMELKVDFDPAFSSTDFATILLPVNDADTDPSNSWDDGDGYFTNPGGGGWSSDAVDFVYSQSWHLGYGYWNTLFGKTYDPYDTGEYEIVLTVLDSSSSQIAQSNIFVVVVPEPSTMALMLGVGGLALMRRRGWMT